MSDTVAATWTAPTTLTADGRAHRVMSTTSHPRFGSYRDDNSTWHPTSGNHKMSDGKQQFSHEYTGAPYAFAAGAARRWPVAKNGS